MKEFGPVFPGTSAGDVSIQSLSKSLGWLVSAHRPGIVTYVQPSELESSNANDILIGLHARSKRDNESEKLKIIHIQRYKS